MVCLVLTLNVSVTNLVWDVEVGLFESSSNKSHWWRMADVKE